MRKILILALSLLLAACSTVGVTTGPNGPSLDAVRDDVGSLLVVLDLPRGLGPSPSTGQLFTFDIANGGPSEHLRLTLVPADGDSYGNLPPPGDGRAYYLFAVDAKDKPAIQAAQLAAQQRGVSGNNVTLGIVPKLCTAGQIDQTSLTVSAFALIPGRTRLMTFLDNQPLSVLAQQPGSTQMPYCA